MPTEIPREALHEILRKLTPAIGRVLAKREKTRPCGRDKNHHEAYCSTCDWIEEVNDSLEQVLDHDIVLAVVYSVDLCDIEVDGIHYQCGTPNYGELHIYDMGPYGCETSDRCYISRDLSDLPALVAEAWAM